MLAKIESLRKRAEKIDYTNRERIRVKIEKESYLNELYSRREKFREEIETARFITRTSAEYYKSSREENLKGLGKIISEFMENILEKEYEVKLGIKRNGNYDYLDIIVNGLEPKDLSDGEKQAFSLAMISECVGNGILVLDETTNSLDPVALKNAVYYLNKMSDNKQVFIIELDENFEIPCTFTVKDGNITKEEFI